MKPFTKTSAFLVNPVRDCAETQVLPSLAFFAGILGGDLAEGAAISLFLVPLLVAVAYLMLRVAHRAEVT